MLSNDKRADRAYRRALNYSDPNDIETSIVDLLTDLLHLADQYEGSREMLATAQLHYRAEGTDHA